MKKTIYKAESKGLYEARNFEGFVKKTFPKSSDICGCFGHTPDVEDFMAGCTSTERGNDMLVKYIPFHNLTLLFESYHQVNNKNYHTVYSPKGIEKMPRRFRETKVTVWGNKKAVEAVETIISSYLKEQNTG